MSIFDTLLLNIPPILRGVQTWKAWLHVLASPLQTLSNDYDLYANKKRYVMQFNGQVCYLEHRLNDEFDATARSIYIDDPQPTNIQPRIITNRSEHQPTLIFRNASETNSTNITFYRQLELQTQYSFVVFVPNSILINNQNMLRSIINFYKVAGTNWQFQAI